ncbi:hypothetical protein [Micromonospora tulbaghiae]
MRQISDTDIIGKTPLSNLYFLGWNTALPCWRIGQAEMLQRRGAAWRS